MRKKTKFLLLRVSVILVFSILAGRVWYVQVVMGSYYKQQADTSKIRLEPVQAERGIIYDSHGRNLVWNTPDWNLLIVPHGVPGASAKAIYRKLSGLMGNHPSARQIAHTVSAAEWNPYNPVLIKAHISTSTAMLIMQLHTDLPGVRAQPASVRSYVQDQQLSLAHILGYAGEISPTEYTADHRTYPVEHFGHTDQVGQTGIEVQMDPFLHGVNGTEEVEVDAGERPVRVLRPAVTVPGDSVYLTIDSHLQQQVSNDLGAALQKLGVSQGVAVVEDVHSGKILAMASLPGYDDNWFSHGISNRRYDSLSRNPAKPLLNLATQGAYPPGSTFKIITATAALQTGVANVNRYVDDTGEIDLGPTAIFHGWKPGGLGPVNVVGALAMSSDIYMYTVAGGNPTIHPSPPYIGGTRLAFWARQFGLGSPTGIELPAESAGLIPTPSWFNHLPVGPLKNPGDAWYIGYNYNMAIGQGFDETTPLQMANVAATVANGGTLYQPRIVDHIVGRVVPRRGILRRSRIVQPFVPTVIRRGFINPSNLALIQQGMHDSVSSSWNTGTSVLTYDPRIDAAGKTGTAEAPGGPDAWWVGYAPYNHPKIAVCVMVPNANAEGAYVGVPIAHKIFEDYFHLKPKLPDRPGDSNWLDDVSQQLVGATASQ